MTNKSSRILAAAILSLLAFQLHADIITYSGVEVEEGAIDGVDLTGQTATISIEFADGLTASGEVFSLGTLIFASYEFSGAGLFTVDVPESNLEFGSVTNRELSFFNPTAPSSMFGMLSGASAGDIGLDPLDGETLADMFARLGDGTSIAFTSSGIFQMLNATIGTLNGGASGVTDDINGAKGSSVTLSLNPVTKVPEPGVLALLAVGLVAMRLAGRKRRA